MRQATALNDAASVASDGGHEVAEETDELWGVDRMVGAFADDYAVSKRYSELDAYMRPLLRYPTLKRPGEYAILFDQYRNGADEKVRLRARDVIVYGNAKLVLKNALRHVGRGLPLLDLMQEGMIGSMRAVEMYEIEKGFRFSTYATHWIRQAIRRTIADKNEEEVYRTPVHEVELINFVRKIYLQLCVEKSRPPKAIEVYQQAKTMDTKFAEKITLAAVARAVRAFLTGKSQPVRLNAPIHEASDETLLDRLYTGPPKTETILDARKIYLECQEAMQRIEQELEKLSPRTSMVIRLRLGLGEFEAMTLEQIAERYEVTRERIRQIEVHGFEVLKDNLGVTLEEVQQLVNTMAELEVIAHAI